MVDGEMVVVSAGNSNIVALNPTGALVWELGDGTRSVNEIAAAVCDAFDVELEIARDDVLHFVESLASEGLLENSGVTSA
jgi:nucleoside-diphosphate-sugar epimerase